MRLRFTGFAVLNGSAVKQVDQCHITDRQLLRGAQSVVVTQKQLYCLVFAQNPVWPVAVRRFWASRSMVQAALSLQMPIWVCHRPTLV